jgi:hypothetical protein
MNALEANKIANEAIEKTTLNSTKLQRALQQIADDAALGLFESKIQYDSSVAYELTQRRYLVDEKEFDGIFEYMMVSFDDIAISI